MRSIAEIKAEREAVKKVYDKYGRTPATLFANAPRALMQTGMESYEQALRWVLGEECSPYPDERKAALALAGEG